MNKDKIWVILSYASHFFLPVIFPALVWIFVKSDYVKRHAKTVFFSRFSSNCAEYFVPHYHRIVRFFNWRRVGNDVYCTLYVGFDSCY